MTHAEPPRTLEAFKHAVAGYPPARTVADVRRATIDFDPWQNAGGLPDGVRPFQRVIARTPLIIARPDQPGPHPTVLFIHGGGWVSGSTYSYRRLIGRLAQQGLVVVAPDYALAPEHPFPAAFDDCLGTVATLKGLAQGEPLLIAGDSAGANLAAALCVYRPALFAAAALIYGIFDQSSLPDQSALRLMQSAYLAGHDPLDSRVSPILKPASWPPTLFIAASEDSLTPQSQYAHAALSAAGVRSQLHIVPGVPHGFMQCELWPATVPTIERVGAFLRGGGAST